MLTGKELGAAIGAAIDLKIQSGKAKSKKEIAEYFEVQPPSIHDWINRGSISKDKLFKLFDYFSDVVGDDHWGLKGGETIRAHPPERGNLSIGRLGTIAWEEGDPLDDDTVEVVDLELPASAGPGLPSWEPVKDGAKKRYKSSWIKRRNLKPEKLGTHIVRGDSMSPTFPDGAILTINTAIERIKHGKVHIIFYMDEYFIKRLFKESDGTLRVASDNPDKTRHPDWIVTPENADELRVMGVPVDMNIELIDP